MHVLDYLSGLNLTSKEYKEAVKNGLWDNAYIDGGVKNNQSIDKERDRTNQAKSLAKEDLSVDKRYIEFIRDVAQITMDAANPRDPFTGNKVIGEKGMTLGLNEKGEVIVTGIIVGRNQGIEVGRIINENNANVIAHFHYEGLDFKHPSSGDHAATKLLNVSNLTVTPKKDRRSSRFSCCNIYEVGRSNGKEKYRNVTRGIGNWREHPEWD